jgi:oxazoline/thiazoline synthase
LHLKTPSLKPHIAWHRISSEQLILCDRDREWLVSNHLYADVLEAIDGATTEEIVERLSATFAPEEVLFALHNLSIGGYVEEASVPLEPPREVKCARSAPVRDHSITAGSPTGIFISCIGVQIDPALIADQLRGRGITPEGGQPAIVFTDDYLNPALAWIDQQNWQQQRNWVLARLHESTVWIGPHFKPGESVCWHCLAQRMREAQWVKQAIRTRVTRSSRSSLTSGPSSERATVLDRLTGEIALMLTGRAIPENTLISVDPDTNRTEQHYVRGVPGCPQCGPHPTGEDIKKQLAMLEALRGGAEDPECFAHLISPLVGLVSQVRDFEVMGERPARIVTAVQPAPEHLAASARRLAPRDLAFGKGYHRAQAVIGCIGEAIERYSIMQGGADLIIGSTRELGDEVIDPRLLLNFSARQYSYRAELNALHGGFNWIPLEFDPTKRIGWVRVVSMIDTKNRLVPAAYCYFGNKQDAGRQFIRADTNGCASGNSVRDAQLRALLELIERDAAAIWWYNRVPRPLVDLDSFAVPMFEDFKSWASRAGRILRVLDITTDLDIPAYVAISARDPSGDCIAFGFGCHADACRGIAHALIEMYQMCVLFETAFEGDELTGFEDAQRRAAARWLREETLETQNFMEPFGSRCACDYGPLAPAQKHDPLDHLVWSLQRHGLESYYVELTRRDIGLPVVRAVVPCLRHFWERLGPGRLYDVPTSLGWIAKPRDERELNPIPMFI